MHRNDAVIDSLLAFLELTRPFQCDEENNMKGDDKQNTYH